MLRFASAPFRKDLPPLFVRWRRRCQSAGGHRGDFAETIAVEHNGSYTKVSRRTIHALERGIPLTPRQARRKQERAYLLSASGTASSYVLTTRSLDGDDTYTIRYRSGRVKRYACVCGRKVQSW